MRKTLIFFTLLAVAFVATACDPTCHLYFHIENATDSDLAITVEGEGSITISPGDSKMIYNKSEMGDAGDYYRMDQNMSYLDVKINNMPMSNSIWKRMHWVYQSSDKYSDTYTLILTEELITILLSENNPTN
jgi:hypothetical protein